jgi:arylsulfatase A-like enzyme
MAHRRPNVIVFFTDQQRHDSTGLHGNPLDLTPNFDRLAKAGTHVANSFTCQPVCGPARSCLQTGLYATQTGCWKNAIPINPEHETLGTIFQQGGYRTGYIGKWHLGENKPWGPVDAKYRKGYEYWLAANALEHTSDAYQTRMWDKDGQPHDLPGYRVDALTDAAIRFVDDRKADPFYLMVSYLEPHHQNHRDDYPAPDGYAERYHGRWTPPDLLALGGSTQRHLGGYWGMVKRCDEALGRLVDTLKSLKLLDNTIILFTSDHANHFKTRNGEYKRSCHDSSIRVPTMLHGGPFTGGGQISKLVSLVDLPPTLVDAAGLEVPSHMSGRSILPLLGGGRGAEWPGEVFVQISESQTGRAIRTSRWKYAVTNADGSNASNGPGLSEYAESELYDLLADPYELRNLIKSGAHVRLKDRLRQRLVSRMTHAGETEPVIQTVGTQHPGQMQVSDEEIEQ